MNAADFQPESFEDLTDAHLGELKHVFKHHITSCEEAVTFWRARGDSAKMKVAAEKRDRMMLYLSLVQKILNR